MAQFPTNFDGNPFMMEINQNTSPLLGRIGPCTQYNFGDTRNGLMPRDIGNNCGISPNNMVDRNKQMQQNQAAPFSGMNYYPQQSGLYNNNNNNNNNNANWYGAKADNLGGVGMQQPLQTQSGYGYLPLNLLDQLRNCPMSSSPIFILPSGVTNSNLMPPQQPPQTAPYIAPMPACIPYTIPMPIYQTIDQRGSRDNECRCPGNTNNKLKNKLLAVCEQLERGEESMPQYNNNSCMENRNNNDSDTVLCSKKNCTASIQLQAMIAQLLGIQGLIACAITRILLKKIPGSQINESIEEIMERTQRCIRQSTKDQLVRESKLGQDVQRLLSLYLTSPSTPVSIIPTLTSAQIKSNILKVQIENTINARVMEDQGCGMEAPEPLDNLILEVKSDSELRQLLALLREKECEERVNLNFAAYSTQKFIAESRLNNVQQKICQVEKEMDKRRNPNGKAFKYPEMYGCVDIPVKVSRSQDCTNTNVCVAPNICASPKKLLLKPHVGSPETTYSKSDSDHTVNSNSSKNKVPIPSKTSEKNRHSKSDNSEKFSAHEKNSSECSNKDEPNKNNSEKKKRYECNCMDSTDCEDDK